MALAAVLMQPNPSPAGLGVNVLDAHSDDRADTREGICEEGNNGPIAEAAETGRSVAVDDD